jgi:hypothetical protein
MIKICDAWQGATVPRNVVGAVRAAGLVLYPGRDHRLYLKFEESEAIQLHNSFPRGIHLDDVIEDASCLRPPRPADILAFG